MNIDENILNKIVAIWIQQYIKRIKCDLSQEWKDSSIYANQCDTH